MDAVSPEWMVISAGKRNVGTNKSFMHPQAHRNQQPDEICRCSRESQVCRCLRFGQEGMSGKVDLGDLFVNGTNGQVVLSTDGSEIEALNNRQVGSAV